MNKNIKTSNGYIGLPEQIYKLKPAKNTDFKYAYPIDEFHEPQNIIEEIRQVFKNAINNAKNIGRAYKGNLNIETNSTN